MKPITELDPGGSLRVQLAGLDGRVSTVLTAFSAKRSPDMYIAPRVLGGDVKISLHASGSYQVGLTREAASRRGTDNRHWEIWDNRDQRRDLAPGVERAWYMLLPDEELRSGSQDPNAYLLPPVGHGHAASVEFLLVSDVGPELAFDEAHIVARFRLASAERSCLVVARRIAWVAQMQALARASRYQAEAHAQEARIALNAEHRFFIHGNDEHGVRFGLELAAD